MFVECFWDEISSSLFYINFQQYSYLQFWDSRKFTRRTGNPSSDFQPTRFQNRSSFRRFLLFAMSIFQPTIPKSTDVVAGARRMLLAWVKQLWKKNAQNRGFNNFVFTCICCWRRVPWELRPRIWRIGPLGTRQSRNKYPKLWLKGNKITVKVTWSSTLGTHLVMSFGSVWKGGSTRAETTSPYGRKMSNIQIKKKIWKWQTKNIGFYRFIGYYGFF